MAIEIIIDFAPLNADGASIHKVQNFGEDLYRLSREDREIDISIEDVDRATTQLRLVLRHNRQHLRVIRQIETLLAQHFLSDFAQLTERKASP